MNGAPKYRFGPFELDRRSYELRREGEALRLEKIPMELLIFLVERNGELVTRDQIAERLWGKDVFLDTEQGINTAVRKVRQILQDGPDSPMLLDTVVGKGYRFTGQVTEIDDSVLAVGATTTPPESQTSRITRRYRLLGAAGAFLALAAISWMLWLRVRQVSTAATPGSYHSIAVLPLANLSGDPSQEYFADGMTDELTTELAKVHGLRVISRTSVMQYKNTHKTMPEIARELTVDAVVEGSVMRSGDRVRVTAQLIDARADRHIWAEDYERDMRDVLSLQSELVGAIAGQVRASISPDQPQFPTRTGAVEPAAYESYLRGRSFWNQRTPAGLAQAVAHFQHAIDLDPDYAEAYSGLADTYTALGYLSYEAPRDTFPQARELANKALQIDPGLAEARASVGYAKLYYDWDWKGAEEEFQKAIAVNPNCTTAYHWYSVLLTARGQHEQALSEIRRAHELDPLSVAINTDIGFELYYARRYDEAATQLRSVLQTSPKFPLAHLWLGRTYEQMGMYREATTEFGQAGEALKDWPVIIAAAGHAYGKWGHEAEANGELRRMKELAKDKYVTPYGMAVIFAGLDDKDQTMSWLQKAYEERSNWLVWLKLDPRFDNVRSDPRFQELLKRMKV
jgi:TolB-like protein/DNA-binding winged helix-turn-helix (wHTH) protein/tetratricopeptide (TPR) repeat protein